MPRTIEASHPEPRLSADERIARGVVASREIERAVLPPLPSMVVEQGECRGKPHHWFFGKRGDGNASYKLGKQVCATCPVRLPCRDWAREQPVNLLTGLWGGESQRDRRRHNTAVIALRNRHSKDADAGALGPRRSDNKVDHDE